MRWSPIRLLASAELRRHWLGFVLIGLLAGFVAAVAGGSMAVARRTDTAVDRLADAAGVGDALVNIYGDTGLSNQVAELDVVDAALPIPGWAGVLDARFTILSVIAPTESSDAVFHPTLVAGRPVAPDSTDEVVMFEGFARETGVEIGAEFSMTLLTTEQSFQFEEGFGEPAGPMVDLRVVGIVRTNSLTDQLPPFVASPAFAEAYAEHEAGFSFVAVNLSDGSSSGPELESELQTLPPSAAPVPGLAGTQITVAYPTRASAESVASARGLLVGGLVALAAIVAVAGMLAIGQALSRVYDGSRASAEVEAALGLTWLERLSARILSGGATVAVATALTTLGVVAAGRIEPLGALRAFEPSPGFAPNLVLVGVAALTTAVVTTVLIVLSAAPATKVHHTPVIARTSPFTERLAVWGGDPATTIGARLAFEPPRHRFGVPLRSVRTGLVLAVAGVTSLLVVSGNLARLLDQPARFGARADFTVSDLQDDSISELLADDRVAALSVSADTGIEIDGRSLTAAAIDDRRGTAGWTILAGTFPATQEELVLGSRVAQEMSLQVGDVVEAAFPDMPPMALRVVGIGVGPDNNGGSLGGRVLMSMDTLERTDGDIVRNALVIVRDGVDPEAVRSDYSDRWEISERVVPAEVTNLEQVGGLPRALAGFLVIIGTIALANGLVVAVRRRRSTIAVLRTMGFTPRQAGLSIISMTSFMVVAAIAVGLPLGVALGAVVWRAVADGAAIAPDVLVPWPSLLLVGLGTMGIAILISILPARRASRLRPAEILRET